MNNPYNMWTPRPFGHNMPGFNSPPRPNWSPFPAQAPVQHIAQGAPTPFMPNMYHQPFQNNFCRPPHSPMGNQQPQPARFAQYQFHSNQNGFNNNNQQQQGFVNQARNSFQPGSSPQPKHNNPYQRDKKQGNQNQHFKDNKNQNQNGKKKKNKPNKRDLPENCAFYCDVCDRGFKTEEKYNEHVDGHEKCKEEGCSYVAAPKLVQLHVRNHHQTGLAKKIWSVESKEDIAKWIAERKRHFPTSANIEKKKALESEKEARGEVLNEKQFYHRLNDQRQRRKGHWEKKRKFNDHFNEDSPPEKKKTTEKEETEVDDKEQICDKKEPNGTTESSDPLSTILNTADSVSPSKDDDSKEEDKSPSSDSVVLPSSLKALQTIYNSDEEDVNEDNANENSKPSTEPKPEPKPEPEPEPPCDTTVLKDMKNSRHNHHQKSRKTANQVKHEEALELAKRPWQSKVFKRDRPTLLEKLLAKEIRHERNVILQCIRHIVTNNFFQKPISESPDK